MNHDATRIADNLADVYDNRRLVALVGAHILLSAAPILAVFAPSMSLPVPFVWALESLSIGTLLTIAFWLGMGGGGFFLRLALAAIGVAFTQIWMVLTTAVTQWTQGRPITVKVQYFLSLFGMAAVYVGVLAAGFLVARLWYVLIRTPQADDAPARDCLKFSVMHLLAAMSLCGVGVTLVKLARTESDPGSGAAATAAAFAVGFGVFFANTFLAALAALGRRPLLPRILAALAASLILGVAFSLAAGHDRLGPGYVAGGGLIAVLPTLVVIASLLVARSCGFRLVRRPAHMGAARPPHARWRRGIPVMILRPERLTR